MSYTECDCHNKICATETKKNKHLMQINQTFFFFIHSRVACQLQHSHKVQRKTSAFDSFMAIFDWFTCISAFFYVRSVFVVIIYQNICGCREKRVEVITTNSGFFRLDTIFAVMEQCAHKLSFREFTMIFNFENIWSIVILLLSIAAVHVIMTKCAGEKNLAINNSIGILLW